MYVKQNIKCDSPFYDHNNNYRPSRSWSLSVITCCDRRVNVITTIMVCDMRFITSTNAICSQKML